MHTINVDLLNEFTIDQIGTSAYHLHTNRACKRFNGTLKSVLTDKFPLSRAALPCRGFFSPTAKYQWRHLAAVPCSSDLCRFLSRHGCKSPTFAAPNRMASILSLAPWNVSAMLLTLLTSRRRRNALERNISVRSWGVPTRRRSSCRVTNTG